MRDFLGREAAYLTKRQCDLGIWGKRRMTAREDQSQTIVFERLLVDGDRIDRGLQLLRELRDRGVETRSSAEDVDGLEATGGDEPRERVTRQPVARPFLDRGREGLVEGLLGQVEVTDEPNERGQDPARV
ncbi:MAG TPA: hypothetical protein VFB92_13780 [Vicinamibacterales bacterium]|nr:hypothetical protein [Vicinamibacterales bacterium]